MTDFRYIDLRNLNKEPEKSFFTNKAVHRTIVAGFALAAAVMVNSVLSKPHQVVSEEAKQEIKQNIRRANTDLVHGITCWGEDKVDAKFQEAPLGRKLTSTYIADVDKGLIVGCDVTEDFDGSLARAHRQRARQAASPHIALR